MRGNHYIGVRIGKIPFFGGDYCVFAGFKRHQVIPIRVAAAGICAGCNADPFQRLPRIKIGDSALQVPGDSVIYAIGKGGRGEQTVRIDAFTAHL
jgi:hypothetical protein